MLFTVGQVTVQYLVGATYSLLIMPVRILIPTLISDFGRSYSLPNGVTDRFTILAGTHYFSPDEVEVFYLA